MTGYATCFVCGQENPKGLHIHFEATANEGATATLFCDTTHEGWPGIVHGGVLSAMLDEATAYVTFYMNVVALTASLQIGFDQPVRVGEQIRVEAVPVRKTRRVIEVEARIVGDDGLRRAHSTARMLVLSDHQRQLLGLAELPGVGRVSAGD